MNEKRPKRKRESVWLGDEIAEYFETLEKRQGKEKRGTASGGMKRSMGLLLSWQRVTSDSVFEHTDNVVFSKKSKETEILVYVDNATYAAELTMDKELYRIKMQQEIQKEISDIKFLVSRKSAFRKGK